MENLGFLDLIKTSVFWSKKCSFLSTISKNDLFWLICSKNTHEKIFEFVTKTWTNRFGTFGFLAFSVKLYFPFVKSILSTQNIKNQTFLAQFVQKIPKRNYSIFLQKPCIGLSRLRWAPFEHFFEFGALFCILSTLKHFFALWATFEQYFTFRATYVF